MPLIDIGHLTNPMHDFFNDANRAIFQLAQALEETQGELENAQDEITTLRAAQAASETLIQELMERVHNLENYDPRIG